MMQALDHLQAYWIRYLYVSQPDVPEALLKPSVYICHSIAMSLCILSIVAPDVTNIDSKLQVERVDLQTSTATVEISFPVSDGG